jgi:hypothetical protein
LAGGVVLSGVRTAATCAMPRPPARTPRFPRRASCGSGPRHSPAVSPRSRLPWKRLPPRRRRAASPAQRGTDGPPRRKAP